MKINSLKTLPQMNEAVVLLERALRAPEQNTPEDVAAGRELLRKVKEMRRIFIYRQKSFTSNGHVVRH